MGGSIVELTEYHAPDGVVFRFNSDTKFLLSEEGLGMPPIQYITQKGPLQHGETFMGFSLEPRTIQMLIRQNGCSRDEYWANRRTILSMLRPNRQTLNHFDMGTLRKVLGDGTMRDIDVFIMEGPLFAARSLDQWDEWSYQESIRFIAPNPTFYNPTQKTSIASISTVNSLIFYNAVTGPSYTGVKFFNPTTGPTVRQLEFSSTILDTTLTCTTSGDWPVFPEITVVGPAEGLYIFNETTNELIRINYNLATGQTIKVELGYGQKRVYLYSTGENIIGTVSPDSDLATFHLEPDPGATGGANTVRVYSGSVTAGVTAVTIAWYDRYIGI